jgi:polysaccharide export outer membrane protein
VRSVVLSWVGVVVSLGSGVSAARAAQVPAADTAPAAVEESAPYYVAPGDVLRIAVWKEPELSTDVFVRLDGMITVSVVGDVRAAGKTTEQIATEVRTKLRSVLEVPQVTVTVAQAVSARFYVVGEVAVSGAFPLTGRITILQALALAGGFREFAKRDRIVVIRERRGQRQAIVFNFRDLEAGINLEQNIAVEAGDTLIVP